jgi:hypothetical protein
MELFQHRDSINPPHPPYSLFSSFALLLYFLVMAMFGASQTVSLSSAWGLDFQSFVQFFIYCEENLSLHSFAKDYAQAAVDS